MAKFTLSKVLHRRQKLKVATIVMTLLVVGLLFQLLILNNPKQLKAAVIINGTEAIIDGANTTTFVVDQIGNVYQQPGAKLMDDNNNNLDFRYYSYLATPTNCEGKICNVKGKNLTVRNGQVLMEGTQSYKNLIVDKSGSISQPMADRDGMINKPLYSGNYWGMRFTGFLKVPANSVYYLYSDDVAGGVKIEYSTNTKISNEEGQNSWTPFYINASDEVKSGWNSGNKINLSLDDYINSKQYAFLQNESTTDFKWIPIRISYARGADPGALNLKYQLFQYFKDSADFFPNNHLPYSQGTLELSRLYGYADGIPQKTGGEGQTKFEYFVSLDGKTVPNTAFSNSFLTVGTDNTALKTSFANSYGYTGGETGLFKFAFGGESQAASPIGDSIANIHRTMASRHSAYTINPAIFPAAAGDWPAMFKSSDNTSRRIESGLTLNIDNEVKIDTEKGINLTGVGYPGWGNEFYKAADMSTLQVAKSRAGGAGGGEFSTTLGGGGSHARNGGAPLAVSSGTGKTYYDDATEVIGKTAIGSGGGSSNYNIGGSGGGAVRIVSKKTTLNVKSAIVANGNGGMVIDAPYNVAGGAGGKIVIKSDEINVGSTADSGATKNEVISADGFGGYKSCTGGSGGYILIAYNISNDDVINSKSYSFRFHTNGGVGIDTAGANSTTLSGENGVVSVVKKSALEAVTVKKWLEAIDRPIPNTPPNPNFNPYSVQLKDKIRVNIEISQAAPGFETNIDDAILKVPDSSEKCRPIDGTIAAPNNSSLSSSGYDTVNNKVYWVFIPNTSDPILVSYDCEVSN